MSTETTGQATRRAFLGTAALTAASYKRVLGANDRIGVGQVGFGLIGRQHIADLKSFSDVDYVGLCDCYAPRVEEGIKFIGNGTVKGYSDFRKMYENKDIQAVVVASPDHWHALLTVMACAAGKDVYVEKPLTVFVDEGKWMVQAARQYKRIVTVGTQRRHYAGVKAAKGLVQGGTLGKIHNIKWSACRNIYPGFGKTPVSDPPKEFDYEMWLGPAPKHPYQAHRGLYHFRWFWDHSGGQMTNLGAHTIDQILWIMDAKGPTSVMAMGGRYALEDDGETPDLQDAIWEFPGKDGQPGWTMQASIREASVGSPGLNPGQLYLGTKGYMTISGNYQISSESKGDPVNQIPRFIGQPTGGPVYNDTPTSLWLPDYPPSQAPAVRGAGRGAGGQGRGAGQAGSAAAGAATGAGGFAATGVEPTMILNERDWLDCVKSRKKPFCEVEEGHRVATACNLANMSLRLKRGLRWDPEKEEVIGDKEAASMAAGVHLRAESGTVYRGQWDKALRACVKV
jgi:predicted dehydrogenase